jgi:nicotinamidase/pyrazinamidase
MKALLVVDVENDFMPGGALGISGADQIIPVINRIIPHFTLVLAAKDWHPEGHQSFAENHPGKKPGDIVTIHGIQQILWPAHCIRETRGSEFAPGLKKEAFDSVFFKGTDPWVDSYSAFFDNARQKATGLADYLKSRRTDQLFIVGIATEYCVLYSVLDALEMGISVTVVSDACKGINLHPGDADAALIKMAEKGATIITSDKIC